MSGDMLAATGRFWWPLSRLGEALEALARCSGLVRAEIASPLRLPAALGDGAGRMETARWLDWASTRLGVEAVEVDTPAAALERLLLGGGPAIILHDIGTDSGFFALAGATRGQPLLLAPELKVGICPIEPIRALLAESLEAPLRAEIDHLLEIAQIAPQRRPQVAAAMLRERLAGKRIAGAFLLRLPASAPMRRQLREAGIWRILAGILALFALVYLLEIAGWGMIGSGVLGGRLEFGWLGAWVLVLLSGLLVSSAGSWLEARFALEVSRIVKSRLLAGALAIGGDAVKRSGVGQIIGRVIESQALESLSLNGGLSVLVAALELVFAGWVLGQGAAPASHLLLLALWTALTIGLGGLFWRRGRHWSVERLDMTNSLIEAMVGHRTRLAQERPERRVEQDDLRMQSYLAISTGMDRIGQFGVASLPSLWMFAGIALLVPAFARSPVPSGAALAISLGGLFLAQRGLAGIAGGLAGLSRALIAWQQVRLIFRASAGPEAEGPFLPAAQISAEAEPGRRLIDAEGLAFSYRGSPGRVIDDADLAIRHGDRLLLEGGSGGGKSTLAALLTGLEQPDSGLLLLNGLDRPTLGANWHRLATAAPQFHENHILSGTLGFNLLMGRQWPASEADLAEAEALCEQLGLGDLLRRMPGGINQRVGETGWQLSHGERSRIFLARALLQDAALTIMDESFAALDPETLDRCLACAMQRAKTLVVIAHP